MNRVGPVVDIVIPLYNLSRFVGEAIESALAQTLAGDALEIIVVDDGSTDASAQAVQRYVPRVRYLFQQNRGLSAARNAGWRAGRARFVMFLDADDRVLPEKLAEQLAVFRVRPEVGLVYTGVRYIDVDGAPLPQRGWARLEGEALPHLVVSNRFPPHSPLVSREVLEQVGGFDEGMVAFGRGAEDWDLWLRIARRGVPFACVDRPLAEYRVRPDAMHQDPGPMTASSLRVLDKAFGDPALPAEIAALRPLAYQRAYLVAAGDYYRVGDRAAGSRWFRAAVRERPELVTEFESLAEFCRSLLPLGYQRGTIMAAEWRRLARTLRTALTDLFADSALDEEVSRLRWPAERAFWRAVLPLAARRAKVALGGGARRARLRADHLRLLEFERASGSLAAARG